MLMPLSRYYKMNRPSSDPAIGCSGGLGVNTLFGAGSLDRVKIHGTAYERNAHAKGRAEVNAVRRTQPGDVSILRPFSLECEILDRVLLIESAQRHINDSGKSERDDGVIAPLHLGRALGFAVTLEHMDADVRDGSLPLISPAPLQADADNLGIME
jgi:hypothetical protein